MRLAILWPTFALVSLVFAVWLTMFVQRTRHMRDTPPRPEDFASGEAALRYFRPVEMGANNLANLFEMPVLYFALVPLLLVTRHADQAQIVLAWGFVGFRIAHSIVHIARGKVTARFGVYLASCVVLAAMWIGFAIDMVTVPAAAPAAASAVTI